MDNPHLQEDSGDSVFAAVSALCRHLSSKLEGDAETKENVFRELRKLAYSYLLKKKKLWVVPSDTLAKDVPLELFMCIAQKQSQVGRWTEADFAKATTLMERYEALATNNPQNSWLLDMGKLLLAFERHHSTLALDYHPYEGPRCGCCPGIEDIPTTFRLFKPSCVRLNLLNLDGFDGYMCRKVITHLELMRDPPSLRWLPNFAERVARTQWITEFRQRKYHTASAKRTGSQSSYSSPITDEGFSSPLHDRARTPIDWSTISASTANPRREWETIGDPDPFDESIFDNPRKLRRLRKSFLLSPCHLVKVDRTQLNVIVKSLLTGIATDIFPLVENKFAMKPGLYTDGTTPLVMISICKPLRKAGELFANMNEQQDNYPCSTSSAMDTVIKNYLLNYQAMVLSIPDDVCVLKLAFAILPFIDQLKYLSKLRKEVLQSTSPSNDREGSLHGWRLLQKLNTDLLENGDPNLDELISGLFLDCCQVYFGFIDDWIFEGKWHADLFFQQNVTSEKVVDRYSWIKMFTFSPTNAPDFLPAKRIFECGKAVHLVRQLFMSDGALFSRECRPEAKLVNNRKQLQNVKFACQFYAHIGDDYRSAVRSIFVTNNNSDEELLRAVIEKASADALKFTETKTAAHEQKIAERRRKLECMKEELKMYEHHKSIEKLKSSIYDLMQDDQMMLSQLNHAFASSSLRYELIERYIEEMDRIMKKTLLNTWKERRYALTAVRENHFADLNKREWVTPEGRRHEDSRIDSRFTSASVSEVDAAPSAFISFRGTTPDQFKQTQIFVSEVSESVGGAMTDERSGVPPQFETCMTDITEDRTLHEAIRLSPNLWFDDDSNVKTDDTDVLSCEKALSENLYSPYSNEESCDLDSENPLTCCQFIAPTDDMSSSESISPQADADNSNEMKDSYDRIIKNYRDRIGDGTLKPFDHISRYKNCRATDAIAKETSDSSEISQTEFSKSSVSYYMKKSITYPLEAQNKVMNNLILHKFFVENEFLSHLKRLRDVFFRHNGVGALSFTRLICRKIEERAHHPETFLVHPKLQNILNISFPADSDFVSLKTEITVPSIFDLTEPYVINCLRITYVTDWPLKLILTEKAIAKYNDVFQFLFSIDRTLFYVMEASQSVKTFSVMAREHFTQIHLQLHVMLVILNAIKLYTGFCITSCWEKFHNLLENVKCPEQLYRVHVKYLKNILNKFMLAKQMSRVHEGLTNVLHYILEYCQTLKHCDWSMFTTEQQYRVGSFKKLNHAFENFSRMVEGTSSFLEYYIRQKGQVHLKMLHHSLKLTGSG